MLIIIGLYLKNLVYFTVPIADTDMISVPPLEGNTFYVLRKVHFFSQFQ